MVVTAAFDSLRDQGVEYAAPLRASGGDVEHIPGSQRRPRIPSFTGDVAQARAVLDRLEDAIEEAFPG